MKHVEKKNERDRRVIESLAWSVGPLSREEIHEMTHLRRSDITRLVKELLAEGRLVQAGRADNPMGRKQELLRLNEELGYALAIGFDHHNLHAAVVDPGLQLRSVVREPTRLDGNIEGLVGQLIACAREAVRRAGADFSRLFGIAVAAAGFVDNIEGRLVRSSDIEFLKQVALRAILEKEFGVTTLVENLTRAKAMAEKTLGAGGVGNDMIYVEYARAGIEAAILIGGKVFHGSGCAAGEFGHTHLIDDGPACKCGSFGCLEAVAGFSALEARIKRAIAEGSSSEALALAQGDVNKITALTILQAAGQGDKACMAIVGQMGNHLGIGLANLVNLFNPAELVIDKRLALAGRDLLEEIIKTVRRKALSDSVRNLVIRFGSVDDEAGALGAARMVLDTYFEIPALKPPRFMIESVPPPSRASLRTFSAGPPRAVAQHEAGR
jgi:predicted NBD/HSP70 family sugar kinase